MGSTGQEFWRQPSPFGVFGFDVVPGGPSGDPTSELYATQLGFWLTSDYHFVAMARDTVAAMAETVEVFRPAAPTP